MGGSGRVSGRMIKEVAGGSPGTALGQQDLSGPVTRGQKGPTHGVTTPGDRRTLVTAETHPVPSHTQRQQDLTEPGHLMTGGSSVLSHTQ